MTAALVFGAVGVGWILGVLLIVVLVALLLGR